MWIHRNLAQKLLHPPTSGNKLASKNGDGHRLTPETLAILSNRKQEQFDVAEDERWGAMGAV